MGFLMGCQRFMLNHVEVKSPKKDKHEVKKKSDSLA